MNRNDERIFYKDLDLFTWKALGKSIFAMTKEQREQYWQSAEYKECKRQDEEYERKRQEEHKLKRNELKEKYTKKERQEYGKKCEEEYKKIRELKKLEFEKNLKIKQEEEQQRHRIKQEQEAKLLQKTDKYLKTEYLFYKLFDTIEKRKLINFDLYKDYNLLLPIYNDFKKSPPYNYYLKDIPKRYILDKYFTLDKIEEIKQFEIFNDKEIEELINIFTYKPMSFGALMFHNVV
jgi:flagellar biosynthesis GTPase FlhF